MSIEDDDLEKAGTRSRRPLTNSKQYSVYPPKRPSTPKYKQKSLFTFALILFFTLFVFFYSNSKTTTKSSKTFQYKDTSQFNDSSQFTDYNHLSNLLNQNKGINLL